MIEGLLILHDINTHFVIIYYHCYVAFALQSRSKGSNASSVGSPVEDEERMRPGLGTGGRKDIQFVKIPQTSSKVLFQSRWKGKERKGRVFI